MGPELLGFIGIIVLFGLLALGMWVDTAAAFVGIIGLIAVLGPQQAFTIIGSGPYSQITNYNMITIPMFILMAMFIAETRLGSDCTIQLIRDWSAARRAGGGNHSRLRPDGCSDRR